MTLKSSNLALAPSAGLRPGAKVGRPSGRAPVEKLTCRSLRSAIRPCLAVVLLGLALVPLPGRSCSVPVFRYALERWTPSSYDAIVFHRGPLPPAQQALVDRLSTEAVSNGPPANILVRTVDVAGDMPPAVLEMWKSRQTAPLPCLVLLYPKGAPAQGEVWSGPLSAESVGRILDSPARRRVAQRLLKGDCAVWLLLESGNKPQDDAAARLLQSRIESLQKTLKLSKLEAEDLANRVISVPEAELKVAFSCLPLRRTDPAEEVFVRMLLGSEDDLAVQKEPIAFLIFGRGRALFGLVGKGINDETIEEASAFLVGPCSCVVKEENPGLDLLMAVDWESQIVARTTAPAEPPELTGLTALPVATSSPAVAASAQSPLNPPWSVKTPASASKGGPDAAPRRTMKTSLLLAALSCAVILLGGTLWLTRRRH